MGYITTRKTHLDEIEISSKFPWCKQIINKAGVKQLLFVYFLDVLFTFGSIRQSFDSERLSDESRGTREIYIYLALLADSWINGGAKISIKSSVIHGDSFFFVHSDEVMSQVKIILFGLNCWLWLAGLGRKGRKGVKQTRFVSKTTSLPHAINQSILRPLKC